MVLAFTTHIDWAVAAPSVLIGLTGIIVAMVMYRKETSLPDRLAGTFKTGYKWAYNKFYIDEVYLFVTKKVLFGMVSRPVAWFDRHVVDGTMNAIAGVTQSVSFRIRGFQSGQIQKYGFVFISGTLLLALVLLYMWS